MFLLQKHSIDPIGSLYRDGVRCLRTTSSRFDSRVHGAAAHTSPWHGVTSTTSVTFQLQQQDSGKKCPPGKQKGRKTNS
ncbi:hypothetical protein E2C01_014174 [Portunus trituberculatus]|uniref:Uncharacterized protein n=1 Tax=Portunus trituberculatus TaxID=210409 RepID=A0A5B7DJ35_PORTR|nr:hypothetical protein [Portunus trituberculatus]